MSIPSAMREMLGKKESRRKPVSKTTKELLLYQQENKCAGCKKSFERMGVTPRIHHVGKTNRIDTLELLCPNCHSKAHTWKTKTRKVPFGGEEKERVLVKKRMGKKKTIKKKKRKRTPRKKKSGVPIRSPGPFILS